MPPDRRCDNCQHRRVCGLRKELVEIELRYEFILNRERKTKYFAEVATVCDQFMIDHSQMPVTASFHLTSGTEAKHASDQLPATERPDSNRPSP